MERKGEPSKQTPLGNDFSYMQGFKKPRTHARKAHELKSHFIKVLTASKQLEGEKGGAVAEEEAEKAQMNSPHHDSQMQVCQLGARQLANDGMVDEIDPQRALEEEKKQ